VVANSALCGFYRVATEIRPTTCILPPPPLPPLFIYRQNFCSLNKLHCTKSVHRADDWGGGGIFGLEDSLKTRSRTNTAAVLHKELLSVEHKTDFILPLTRKCLGRETIVCLNSLGTSSSTVEYIVYCTELYSVYLTCGRVEQWRCPCTPTPTPATASYPP
jgi:hypothetical protein